MMVNGKGEKMLKAERDTNNNHIKVEINPLFLRLVGKSSRYELINLFCFFQNFRPSQPFIVNNFITALMGLFINYVMKLSTNSSIKRFREKLPVPGTIVALSRPAIFRN